MIKNIRPVPFRAVHPGEILGEELNERGIKLEEFAKQIAVSRDYLTDFLNGTIKLTEKLATKFEQALGIPAKSWLNLRKGYIEDCKAIEKRSHHS